MNDFGAVLRAYRRAADLGINELARAVGVDASYVSKLESGVREPRPWAVEQFTRALGLGRADADRLRLAAGLAPWTCPRCAADLQAPWPPRVQTVAEGVNA